MACSVRLLAAEPTPEPIRFDREIRPLLAENCFPCHGPDDGARKADLRLDIREGALAELDGHAAIVPGRPEESELYRRIVAERPSKRMPPRKSGKELRTDEIEKLERWIREGAPYALHWAFEPVSRPEPPQVRNESWPRSAIDRFILARLEREGLAPSPEAGRETLVRRLHLDITGLPPLPEEVAAFVSDEHPDAYSKVADRLLASVHFGERWGRHWLDHARYADSHGYTNDDPRTMWPYRDWVIGAVAADMPFDEFTVEQLAGDLLPAPTRSQLVATGFHRNTLINTEGGAKPDQFRVESVADRVHTTGQVWLGLTVGCARCHSHKFDPISQREYYQLFSFFDSTEDQNSVSPTIPLPSREQEAMLARLDAELDSLKSAGSSEEIQKKVAELEAKRKALERSIPDAMVLRELERPRKTHVHIRGDFLRPGEPVAPGVPDVLPPLPAKGGRPDRRDLARWLVSSANPLTPRVTMNRVWLRLFGSGLVETEEDFGTQGALPSHPELLDWLASEFIESGWSLKAMVKLIIDSSAYRQASRGRPDLEGIDPRNRLLARQNRFRVEAEVVRDLALAAGGLLSRKVGGPSVFPPQPEGVYAFTQVAKSWRVSSGEDRYRRGMYTFFYRSAPHPMLTTFDAPKFNETCTRRNRSNTPLQALTMANDDAIVEAARSLAARVLAESHASDHSRIERAFRLALARAPDAREAERLLAFLEEGRRAFASAPDAAEPAAPEERPSGMQAAEAAGWAALARVLLNLDGFITRE